MASTNRFAEAIKKAMENPDSPLSGPHRYEEILEAARARKDSQEVYACHMGRLLAGLILINELNLPAPALAILTENLAISCVGSMANLMAGNRESGTALYSRACELAQIWQHDQTDAAEEFERILREIPRS